MTLKQALNNAINILKKENIEKPIQISKLILANLLQKNKEYILINENQILSEENYQEFIKRIEKIIIGIPLQYITNKQEFMGMEFYVDNNVLIPRPDTEVLVEEVLNIINNRSRLSIIDMCTGSGAIAISIAKYTEDNKIYAVDISEGALEVAKRNAKRNGVDRKIEFINSNMFENVKQKVDIIVSNPPYIETCVLPTLSKQVQNEPNIALDGGKDGLDFYRNLLINSKRFLRENGVIAMEIGYNQREPVSNLFKDEFVNVYCKRDLAGNDRVIVCRNK